MENSQERRSCSITSLPRDTRTSLAVIREWLVRFGVVFERDIAPIIPIWEEALGGMKAATLESLFKRALNTCKFFPKISEILEPLQEIAQTDFENEWQALLDYCREWVHPDIHFSRAPSLPLEIDHAARAAGGVQFLRACSQEELVWRKKVFIEDLTRSRKTGDLAVLLTGGELRKLLRKAAAPIALLPDSIAYTPAIAAARASVESAGETLARMAKPIREESRFVDIEGRRAELKRQAEIILAKYANPK
jgi:hypothetical protein